jgi:hypothetical protein
MPIPSRVHCESCQDWGTVVQPGGKGLMPCPGDELTGNPCTAPTPRTSPPDTTTPQEEP